MRRTGWTAAGTVRAPRAVPRGVLLLVLVAGVLTMHTLGHLGTDHAGAAHPMMAASLAHQPMNAVPDHPAAPRQTLNAPGTGGGASSPLDLCLAVLTAIALALLLRMLGARSGPARGGLSRRGFAAASRGPPQRPSIGLLLAGLSVIRR